ncbi:MAG: hypothetical protein GX129_11280 [Clostridiales bacterium]|jgi:hypothetical protein|nr:hypothetical protein [Clostridiales bacterium]
MKNKDRNIEKRNEEEDNRVVANMNIEGMPWHIQGKPLYDESKEPVPELDKKELRRLTLSATLSGLFIGAIFLIIIFLFIMFSIHIWF